MMSWWIYYLVRLVKSAYSAMDWYRNNLVHVDAASSKRAEDALALLRKSLGSLPVVPLAFANEPSTILTNWILQDNLPHWLIALEEAELRGSQEDSVIRCQKQPLENEENSRTSTRWQKSSK